MRRKQPDTTQRRPGLRRPEPGGSRQSTGGFAAFGSPGERTATGTPSGERPPAGGRYEFLSPRSWRVPTRLVAILVIPVLIGLVFGGLRVNSSFADYTTADHDEKIAQLAKSASELADALESERDLTAIPLMTGQDSAGVAARRKQTDDKLAAYKAAYARVGDDPDLARRYAAFTSLVVDLPQLRANAYSPELLMSATQNAYATLFAPLLAMDNSVGFGGSDATSGGRAIYGVSLAKAAASTQRVLMLNLLVGIQTGRVTHSENDELIQALLVSNTLEGVALNEFNSLSAPADAKVYADAQVAQAQADQRSTSRMPDGKTIPSVSGLMNIALAYSEDAAAGESSGKQHADQAIQQALAQAQAQGLTPANWLQATNAHIETLRSTETTLLNNVVHNAASLKSSAATDAVLNSGIVIAALALAGLLTGFIARSMILGMRTLNHAALEIANRRLPDLVERLSRTDPERVDTHVDQIPLWGKDEIGEVARAFDQVHQQAVSLAAEQALLRGNVNAIFTNLSRRSQSLIQRQLALITDLENHEADPDQLENLFKLDHLATRMRRNGENLLVLAGEEPGRRWNTPVPLVDVLRAAASEVEQYERVELAGIPETEVVGAAVTDLVHLLAELLENATSFSSPQTRVLVNATRLPDSRVLVEIHDKGIGLTPEDFAEINEKLAEPPTVDATISRRMGLFVVGRLSQRHDIRVQLRPSGESAGTTSLVMLPQQLTQVRNEPEPQEEFTVSRIFADQAPAGEESWAEVLVESTRSAAELGFNDHLTGQGGSSGFSPALEAMQRSQRLEQRRRAALEAGPADQAAAIDPEELADSVFGAVPEPADTLAGHNSEEDDAVPYGTTEEYGRDSRYRPEGYGQDSYEQPAAARNEYGYAEYVEPAAQDPYGRDQYGYQDGPGHDQYGDRPADRGHDRYDSQYAEYQRGYDSYGQVEADQRAGRPAAAEPPTPPPAAGGGLPQRRPGQLLPGSAGTPFSVGGGESPNWFTGARENSGSPEPRGHEVSSLGGYGPTGPTGSPAPNGDPGEVGEWDSANDGDWQRAEKLREPSAGGVTASGLPRRVPKQNLVPGNAKPAPQAGPQVSRSPDEVRGRLTNLRRGVEQGRSAGEATGSFRIDPGPGRSDNGQHDSSTDLFGGSNHQER